MKKKALSVGNCGMDEGTLRSHLARQFSAQLTAVSTAQEAIDALQAEKFDLVLINRVFDMDGDDGLSLIRRIKSDASLAETPLMLISNYPEFQAKAVLLGAVKGVGKSTLATPESIARLEQFLAADPAE